MKILLSAITLCLLVTSGLHATEQVSDLLIIRGKHVRTRDTPSLSKAFPDLVIPKFEMISTANYKGYSPSWAVISGQLYLIGIEARIKGSNEMQWDENVLKGQTFPIKVEAWSGEIIYSNSVSFYDPNTDKTGQFDKVTTIIFKTGKLTHVEFDKKVPKEKIPDEATK